MQFNHQETDIYHIYTFVKWCCILFFLYRNSFEDHPQMTTCFYLHTPHPPTTYRGIFCHMANFEEILLLGNMFVVAQTLWILPLSLQLKQH